MYTAKNNNSENYHQPMADGRNQTVLTDQAITLETDELDPAFNQQGPIDPEEEDEEEDDDDFPAREDFEEEDYDLDEEDDLERDTDDEEFY